MALIFDLETNGFLEELTKIHCNVIYNIDKHTYEIHDSEQGSIIDSIRKLREAKCIIGHNIIGFDVPAIKKVFPKWEPTGKLIDTYVWAACAFPNIKDIDYGLFNKGILPGSLIGKHTLESYGYRLGVYKGKFGKTTNWQTWTPEMTKYCKQDVIVTQRLLEMLATKNVPKEQLEIEHQVYKILCRQMRHGILFNVEAAQSLYIKLNDKREKLREEIQNSFSPFFRRKGKLFTPKRDNKTKGYVAGAAHQKIELVEFNPSSSVHISRMLIQKYNWMPMKFSEKEVAPEELKYHYNRLGILSATTPTVDDEILKRLPYPEAKPLAEFQMLQKRCAMLSEGKQAWLKNYNDKTHRIHGAINQFGTVTGRCNHFKPNLGQVTATHHPYGKESRSLFTVPEGYFLVGCDADGLEARCKAHYLTPYDDGKFVKTILEGKKSEGTDIHSLNKGYLEFASRDVVKTWYYAWMYGSGNANLGLVAMADGNYKDYKGDPAKLGAKHRAMFSKRFTGVKDLTNAVQKQAKLRHPKMWLKGLDGRHIPVRAIYSALNTLFQGAGAVVMKKAMVIADALLRSVGLTPVRDYVQVLFIHDEFQFECRTKEIAEIVSQYAADSIRLSGEHFNLKCPLAGSSKIGKTWCDTH